MRAPSTMEGGETRARDQEELGRGTRQGAAGHLGQGRGHRDGEKRAPRREV